ncbi:MAG: Zn-ribbon domain-containing OB-fold protein [Thermoplasmata archaeon]
MIPAEPIRVQRCGACHSRFLPRAGLCPRCGSGAVTAEVIAPLGRVIAATELTAPAAGWSAPHRIALVEIGSGVRLLAVALDRRPTSGEEVVVRRAGDHFEITPTTPAGG